MDFVCTFACTRAIEYDSIRFQLYSVSVKTDGLSYDNACTVGDDAPAEDEIDDTPLAVSLPVSTPVSIPVSMFP